MLPVDAYKKIAEPDLEKFRKVRLQYCRIVSRSIYSYKIVKSITTETLATGLETTKPVPLNHSGWLTLANR